MTNTEYKSRKRYVGGFALLETLIAFVVMAVGLLALLSFHNESQRNVSESKAQAEAVAIAEEQLQKLQSFLVSDDARLSTDGSRVFTGANTTFDIEWDLTDTTGTGLETLSVANVIVTWQDRNDITQQVKIKSEIYPSSPVGDVENFMAMVVAENGSGSWYHVGVGTGTENQPEEGAGDEENNTEDSGTENGNEESETEEGLDFYSVAINGTVTITGSGVQFKGVEVEMIDGKSNPLGCSVTGSSYNCSANNIPGGTAWAARVIFSSNKHICTPSGGVYTFSYTSVTSPIVESNKDVEIQKDSCPSD